MSIPYKFKAETIIKEERTTRANIEEIKEWSEKIKLPELPEEFICLFLVSCCNAITATKETILNYFRIKNEGPEIFYDRDVDSKVLQKTMNVIVASSIPTRMPNNTVIHFFKLTDTNYRHFDLVACMKVGIMLIDVSQKYDPPSEMVVVIDMKGSSAMHLTCIKISAIKKFIDFLQDAMPLKIQQVHFLNTNFVFDKSLVIAKMFMKSELLKKMIPHSPNLNLDEFHKKWIPASCLPKEYGGVLPSSEELHQVTIQEFRELKEFYEAEECLVKNFSNRQNYSTC